MFARFRVAVSDNDVRILGDGVVVAARNDPITIQLTGGCGLRRVFGLNGYYPVDTLIARVAKPVSHLVSQALVLNGRWAYGYFHFVSEVSEVATVGYLRFGPIEKERLL